MAFYNGLIRHGSSFCNRARLNFQAFRLCEMAAEKALVQVNKWAVSLQFLLNWLILH